MHLMADPLRHSRSPQSGTARFVCVGFVPGKQLACRLLVGLRWWNEVPRQTVTARVFFVGFITGNIWWNEAPLFDCPQIQGGEEPFIVEANPVSLSVGALSQGTTGGTRQRVEPLQRSLFVEALFSGEWLAGRLVGALVERGTPLRNSPDTGVLCRLCPGEAAPIPGNII